MANKIRIHVKFGETKVMVPCGDGCISIGEMVERAIVKFRKAQKLHDNDRVDVSNVCLTDATVLDQDDDVCDIFDDKDTAILEYQLFPHDAHSDYVPPIIGALNPPTGTPSDHPSQPPVTILVPDPDMTPMPNTQSSPPTKSQMATPTSNGHHSDNTPTPSNGVVHSTPPAMPNGPNSSSSLAGSYHGSDSGYNTQNMYSGSTSGSNRCPTPIQDLDGSDSHQYGDYDYDEYRTNKMDHSQDFEHDDHGSGATLSQVIEDPGQFTSEMDPPNHHPGASQISMHSFEGTSQPSLGNSQRFSPHSPPSNYDISLIPQGGGFQDTTPSSQHSLSHNVDHHHTMNNTHGMNHHSPNKGNLESPNINTTAKFHFSTSMEKLNDFSSTNATSSSRHMSGGSSQDNSMINTPYRSGSMHPALSQEIPTFNMGGTHNPHDNSFSMHQPSDPMMVMSQVDQHTGWPRNPRMFSNMPFGYPPPRGGPPPYRNQYRPPEYGGGDRSSVSSSYSDYDFANNPYPNPNMYPSHNQFMDKEKKRKQSMEQDGRGRGGMPHTYIDMYGYQRPFYHNLDEDPMIDTTLSQPAAYMMYPPNPYNRFHGFQPPMGGPGGPHHPPGVGPPGMNWMGVSNTGGGVNTRLKNVPSGNSLSQGDIRMRNGRYGSDKALNKPRKGVLRNGDKRLRSNSTSKESKTSINEEPTLSDDEQDEDDIKSSPFQRSSRKSMYLDDGSVWGRWQDKLENLDIDDEYGDLEYSQHTNSLPSDDEDKKKEDEEPSDLGNIHIVELLRGEEPLGMQLVSYTSKGRDLGVFIGEMDSNGFAAKSGELQLFDRILACNGEDFTGESNKKVEERLRSMTNKEPLLRMAVSRGLNLDLDDSTENEDVDAKKVHQDRDTNDFTPNDYTSSTSAMKPDEDNTESSLSSTTPTLISTSITNTRQLGVKKKIEIHRGEKGTFGFGLASRDVATNDDIPIYVKSISTGGPAFKDGRLKIGDRILEVNGVAVNGMMQPEVLNLLRNSKDLLVLVVSRQQLSTEPLDEYSELSQPTSDQGPLPTTIGKNVFVIDIPLDECGLKGLGVTVYGRCSKKREDVGIYIKAIQPGGAAAKEGSLRVNDRLLTINNQSLLNMPNQNALDVLKKSLQQASNDSNAVLHLTVARTAGINRKLSLSMTSFSNQMPALQEEDRPDNSMTEVGIDCPTDTRMMSQEIDHDTLYEEEYNFASQPSPNSQISYTKSQDVLDLSVGSFPGSQHPFSNASKLDYEASSNRVSNVKPSSSPSTRRTTPNQTKDIGGIKNHRTEPQEYSRNTRPLSSSVENNNRYSPRRQSLSPTSEKRPWSMGVDSQTSSSRSRGSSHSPTTSLSRPSSMHSETSDRSTHHNTSSHVTPRAMPYAGAGHMRVGSGSFRRQVSPPYDTLERTPTKERKNDQIQGSPHTLPRQGSGKNYSGRISPGQEEVTSLYSYSSDPELNSNNPFDRTAKHRISIPKKKNSQQPDFTKFKLNNAEPKMEGEGPPSPPLYRTGSDGDLSVHNMHHLPKEMFSDLEVGPSLRMAKSSSLESLQTVMHYTIRADVRNGDGNMGRGREARNSFRRAVDRSYSGEPLPSSTVISLTKSPKKKKPGLLGWFSREKGKEKKEKKSKKKDKNHRSRPGSCVDFDSIGDIAKQYGISEKTIRRMQSHSGRIEGDEDISDEEDDMDYDEEDDPEEMYPSRNYRAL